jgi:hypothetical protein
MKDKISEAYEEMLNENGATRGSIRADLKITSKLRTSIEKDFQSLYMPLIRSVNAQKRNKKYIAHETMEEWGELQGDLTELFNKIEISIENREEKK